MDVPAWFLRRVSPCPVTGCWWWTGSADRNGYVFFQPGGRGGRREYVHRLSLEWSNGTKLNGLCALHRCDNPSCVNPDHLFAGDRAANATDKVKKGRQPKGSDLSKLSDYQAMEIKRRVMSGESTTSLAAQYGLTQPTISRIANGRRWSHLPAPDAAH